jgi:hypothetical protein
MSKEKDDRQHHHHCALFPKLPALFIQLPTLSLTLAWPLPVFEFLNRTHYQDDDKRGQELYLLHQYRLKKYYSMHKLWKLE